MAGLARLFVESGCSDVRTWIQSGNVVFTASRPVAASLPDAIPALVARRFGARSPLILRSAVDLGGVVAGNPFLAGGAHAAELHVAFLADTPGRRLVAALDPGRSPGDAFAVRGREVFLHLPGGVGRTRLTNAYIDATLATVSTLRNWRTVLKLLEMTQTPG